MKMFHLGNEIAKLEDCISNLQDVIKGKKEQLRILQQGGFSDDVFEQKYLQDYVNEFRGNCFGYIGTDRDVDKDKFLENNWEGTKRELAEFLCSRSGRHLSDEEEKINKKMIRDYYDNYFNKE